MTETPWPLHIGGRHHHKTVWYESVEVGCLLWSSHCWWYPQGLGFGLVCNCRLIWIPWCDYSSWSAHHITQRAVCNVCLIPWDFRLPLPSLPSVCCSPCCGWVLDEMRLFFLFIVKMFWYGSRFKGSEVMEGSWQIHWWTLELCYPCLAACILCPQGGIWFIMFIWVCGCKKVFWFLTLVYS